MLDSLTTELATTLFCFALFSLSLFRSQSCIVRNNSSWNKGVFPTRCFRQIRLGLRLWTKIGEWFCEWQYWRAVPVPAVNCTSASLKQIMFNFFAMYYFRKPNYLLYCDLFDVLLQNADDPFYVCDLGDVVGKHQRWQKEFPRIQPHYAVKCNPDKMMLKLMLAMGMGFDCASKVNMNCLEPMVIVTYLK